jgi:hypothetical protein
VRVFTQRVDGRRFWSEQVFFKKINRLRKYSFCLRTLLPSWTFATLKSVWNLRTCMSRGRIFLLYYEKKGVIYLHMLMT